MTKSSGSESMGMAVLLETKEDIQKGWADGPWRLDQLERGATMSRRFPLDQGDKVRMIDDYSVSGVNDSCTIHTKLDLHMVDTFVVVVKSYFSHKLVQLENVIQHRTLNRHETPKLTGRLGFADGFLHGRSWVFGVEALN